MSEKLLKEEPTSEAQASMPPILLDSSSPSKASSPSRSDIAQPLPQHTSTVDHALARDQQVKTWIRVGLFAWGSLFLGMAIPDAAWNLFTEADVIFFGGTGVTLMVSSLTGKKAKVKNAAE